MPKLYFVRDDFVECHSLVYDVPTRFDASGEFVTGDAFVASIVSFSATPLRFALVANGGARVEVGARPICGVVELSDGDRIFVAEREFLASFDALPLPVAAHGGALCPVCQRLPGDAGSGAGAVHLACPRCGARACERCWRGFRGGVCPTPHCDQPASLERALWRPIHSDFIDCKAGDRASPVET